MKMKLKRTHPMGRMYIDDKQAITLEVREIEVTDFVKNQMMQPWFSHWVEVVEEVKEVKKSKVKSKEA